LAACRKEQRDIQDFSQGILEVSCSSVSDITEPLPSKEMFTLVRSHRDRSSEGDLERQRGPSNFEPGEGAWVTMAYSHDHREIDKFLRTYISFIHRSAYDFFFAPNDWNEEHANRCRSLLGHNGESEVYAKVRAGLKKLLWITPSPKFLRKASKKYTLLAKIEECSDKIITYIVHTASSSLTQEHNMRYLDDSLSSMRLELLLGLVKAPSVENRKHVPGDNFSHLLHDGCLRTLDEDRLNIFESTGRKADLRIVATFEGDFLYKCASWETLDYYVQNCLYVLNGRAIAPLVQAALFERFARRPPTRYRSETGVARAFLQNFVQRWFHTLARSHRSLESQKSVWQRIVWLASEFIDNPVRESPKATRLDSAPRYRADKLLYQWTPLASGGNTGWHAKLMITALVSYCTFFINLPEFSEGPRILGLLAQAAEPWNVWIELPSKSINRNIQTALFIRMGSLSTANSEIYEGHHSHPGGGCYRLTCIRHPANGSASPKLLFSVDIDPQVELRDGPGLMAREHARDPLRMARLEQRKVDVLVDAVRQSMKLDEDQKDCMIEGIRAFPNI